MTTDKSVRLSSRQYACLAALIVYTSGLSFLMHASRRDKQAAYLVSTSVFLAELLKFVVSFVMEHRRIASESTYMRISDREGSAEEAGSGPLSPTEDEKHHERGVEGAGSDDASMSTFNEVIARIRSNDFWKLAIPAILYVLQNMLQLFAITTVSPATYQAVTQMKILAASVLSVWLLNRHYSKHQWASVCVLCFGVAVLSTSKMHESHLPHPSSTLALSKDTALQLLKESTAKFAGILAVLCASTLGSGGAVIMELVIKDARASLWVRNAQLAIFSMIASGAAVLYASYSQGRFDPMQHFGTMAWSTVVARSIGGFLIAYVLQQCDAVLKGIATSLAMICSLVVETCVIGEVTSVYSALGAVLIVASSFTYVQYPYKA